MARYIIITVVTLLFLSVASAGCASEIPGTAYSRPNVSGGFDFYDSEGDKIGFSSKDKDGDYVYYNESGSIVGKIKFDVKKGKYRFYDGDDIRKGELSKDRYGGYRYKKIKSDTETSLQMRIRKDYVYANPYGSGIETLPLSVIRGEKSTSGSTAGTGLTTSGESSGLETSSSSLKTSGGKGISTKGGSGLSTKS